MRMAACLPRKRLCGSVCTRAHPAAMRAQVLKGAVRNVHEYGVFVRLEGSRIDALCHKSEVRDHAHELAALVGP